MRADRGTERHDLGRFVLWPLGGAVVSPYVALPVWSAAPGTIFADHIALVVGSVGALVGLVGAFTTRRRRGQVALIFAVAYPTLFVWAAIVVFHGYVAGTLVAAAMLSAALAAAAMAKQLSARMRHELIKFITAGAWVVTALTLPIGLLGMVVVPFAVAVTAVTRAQTGHDAHDVGWLSPPELLYIDKWRDKSR
jgi:uncharacterized membrane protein (UPF0136 family)